MRRTVRLALLAAFGLSSALQAQQADDYALRFNGRTDFVAMPGSATATNSFTMELWANPSAPHEIDEQGKEIYAGVHGQRYAIYPTHGTHGWGSGHAGAGISIGTNGVTVYEHAGDYMPAVLVYAGEISGWTHIAVVYRSRTPFLYIDGRLVAVGRRSAQEFVHPSTGDAQRSRTLGGIGGGVYGHFEGELDDVRIWAVALDDRAMSTIGTGKPFDAEHLLVALDMNRTGAGSGLVVDNGATAHRVSERTDRTGSALMKAAPAAMVTFGTDRTPVFTLRQRGTAPRIGVIDRERDAFSTPLEPNAETGAATSSSRRPTLE